MDANYIITRLKSTLYKYPTVEVLRNRLKNLDDDKRSEIMSNLKMELYKHRNADIQEPLLELVYQIRVAS
jgi:hypothetical protein